MRLLICAGGTGGGVYPALAVLEALMDLQTSKAGKSSLKGGLQCLWVGGEGGMEKQLVERIGIPFQAIPAAGIHGVGLRTLPHNLLQLGKGYLASRSILHAFRPDVMLFTGGYVAVPMAFAGIGTPQFLFVPDIEPGLALKTLAYFARTIAVSAAESRRYFRKSKQVVVSGYPTRSQLAKWQRKTALSSLHLDDKSPILLVLGGSKGAHSINEAILSNLPGLLDLAQVVHITGQADWTVVQERDKALNSRASRRYHPFPYLHEEMGAALKAADLVISRAGASTLGEYPLFGLPAILVPYPHAWRYQKVNAEHLAQNGAALILEDSNLKSGLIPAVKSLLGNPQKMKSMRAAMQSLTRPQAAAEIGRHLVKLSRERR